MSLFEMQQFFYEWAIAEKREDKLSIFRMGGYKIDEMRNDLVINGLKYDITHFMFLDIDMSFPKQMIVMMIRDLEINEKKKVEAITGLYVRKKPPYLPHIYPKFNKKTQKFVISGQFPMNTLFKVEGVGGGCLMVKREVFERTKYPWFKMETGGKKGEKDEDGIPVNIGEDLYFCLKAKPLILCDSRIVCKHYGMNGFDIDTYISYNKLKKKKGKFYATPEQLKKISDEYSKK
jgi:hypothetical protein